MCCSAYPFHSYSDPKVRQKAAEGVHIIVEHGFCSLSTRHALGFCPFPFGSFTVPSPRRGRVCNGSGIVAMPQRTPDKPGVRFHIVEALLDIDNAFTQPIHLVAGRQIQGPEGRVCLWLYCLRQVVLPAELLLKKL